MDAERWERMKEVFSRVIEAERGQASAILEAECAGDKELLRQVRPLVEEHFRLATAPAPAFSESTLPEVSGVVAGRFRVIGRLGSGGFGDVYRVVDETGGGHDLALKILRSPDPIALQYFKREFRSLAGFNHPNIVALHELIAEDGRWMLAMEYVEGADLLAYLTSQPAGTRHQAIRSCLLQLAEGLRELHGRNLLHRDLKPSNVLVTAAGRVVLLDFGLVRAFAGDFAPGGTLVGTPNYMSPEQAAGEPVAAASDWYSVGVILYQALTGRLPFVFNSFAELRRKRVERPAPPNELVPGLAPELSELCLQLLELDPLRRSSYADVMRLLTPAENIPVREEFAHLFVGRQDALRRLIEAYSLSADRPVLLHLSGPSGIGKTVLLREFIRQAAADPAALVFAGRCYEGESVPYQAIDDLIDHIAEYLGRLPPQHVGELLPRNFAVLVKMFPVLSPFLLEHAGRASASESADLRARAFSALRELLGRLAERHRVVLAIDDLQWGDADGCAALADLLSAFDAPPILVLLAYRSEDIGASPWLQTLRDTATQPSNRAAVFMELDRLTTQEAVEFASSLLSRPADPAALEHVVEQSRGNPFLVEELVRWINTPGNEAIQERPFSLEDAVRSRAGSLAEESHHLLELIAVAGEPTALVTLKTAGGIRNVLAARDELAAARLVRLRAAGRWEEAEVYHDRIRAAITATMDAATLRLRHREIASGLETAVAPDPERIAVHFLKAAEPHLCVPYALQAANRAIEVLAFHKAAAFYEMALAAGALDASQTRAAHRQCADALANAGRGSEAAAHYLAACRGLTMQGQLECHILAAEQLLFTGYIDRGLAIFEQVLQQAGFDLPKAPRRLPAGLLLRRVQLMLRGLRWRERPETSVPRSALLKVDTCASVAMGLSLVDIARGATLQSTSLLLALRAGEPRRIARALAMEAAYHSTAGMRARPRVDRILQMAGELATRTGDAPAIGLTAVMTAACAWNQGRWEECFHRARAARAALNERHERVVWERDTARIFEVDGLRWMGRWSEMKAVLPEFLEDARLRGDLYAQAILQMHCGSCAALANDDAEGARAGLAILERWSNTGFHVEHLIETHNQVEIELYLGRGGEAMRWVERRWPALRKSLLLRVQPFFIQMHSLRARAALRAALETKDGGERRRLFRLAAASSSAIEGQRAGWGGAMAELIDGGIAALEGRTADAIAIFQRAESAAQEAGMFLHEAVARRSQGVLMGGDSGRDLAARAEHEMASEGIANPPRISAVMVPIFD